MVGLPQTSGDFPDESVANVAGSSLERRRRCWRDGKAKWPAVLTWSEFSIWTLSFVPQRSYQVHATLGRSGCISSIIGEMDVRPALKKDHDLIVALGLVHVHEKVPSDSTTGVVGWVGGTLNETDAQDGRHSE